MGSGFSAVVCTCLMTERSRVWIPPGAGAFSLLYLISSMSLIRSILDEQHCWFYWKKCLAIQLEANKVKMHGLSKNSNNKRIIQVNLNCFLQEKNLMEGLGLDLSPFTFRIVSFCPGITFLTGICISPINHFPLIGTHWTFGAVPYFSLFLNHSFSISVSLWLSSFLSAKMLSSMLL